MYRKFYENGEKLWERSYRAGKLHGDNLDYWDNGQLKQRATYAEDKLHGKREEWDKSGKPIMECEYDHGELIYQKDFEETKQDP